MFQPDAFRIDDAERQHELIRANPLAVLAAVTADGLEASHVPMLLHEAAAGAPELRFHLAAPNPLVAALDGESEVLCIFQGPESYVSPDWYRNPKLVPTWNYAVVHAYGRPHRIEDAALLTLLSDLSTRQEGTLDKVPWTVDKLDTEAFTRMRRAIVGFHMPIERIQGKWKMSQNRTRDDRRGVVAALSDLGTEAATRTAREMDALET